MSVRMMNIDALINNQGRQRRRSSLFMSITNSQDNWQASETFMRSISPELRNNPSLLLPSLTTNRRVSITPLPSFGNRFANVVPESSSPTPRPLMIRLRLNPHEQSHHIPIVPQPSAAEAADGLHLLASLALRQPLSASASAKKEAASVVAAQSKASKKQGHSCTLCGSIFPSRSRLRRHELMHTGDRPWSCDWPGCGRSFGRKDNMMQHRRTHDSKSNQLRPNADDGHSSLSD